MSSFYALFFSPSLCPTFSFCSHAPQAKPLPLGWPLCLLGACLTTQPPVPPPRSVCKLWQASFLLLPQPPQLPSLLVKKTFSSHPSIWDELRKQNKKVVSYWCWQWMTACITDGCPFSGLVCFTSHFFSSVAHVSYCSVCDPWVKLSDCLWVYCTRFDPLSEYNLAFFPPLPCFLAMPSSMKQAF